MGLREALKTNSNLSIIAALIVAGGALSYILYGTLFHSSNTSTAAFYTTDDGQTVFTASMDHLPPFDVDGKAAVRVWMFTTDDGKTKFPGFLERFTPAAKAKLEAELADFNSGKTHVPPTPARGDTQVKKPGASNPWVSRADVQAAQQITNIQGAGGEIAEPVMP